MHARKRLALSALLIYVHRWMGIAFGLLFMAWFISGVAFIYWGMPRVSEGERMDRQMPIDLSSVTVSPAVAAERHGIRPASLRIAMRGDRPVYEFGADAVFADTGERIDVRPVGRDEAVEIVREWVPAHSAAIAYDRFLEDSDQWTLQRAQRSQMPLHRIALGDDRATHYYVAEGTGAIVMKTDRASRFRGFLSGVIHWMYFTPLRKHGPVWTQFIIWTSFAGAFVCLLGLTIGVWRFSLSARFREKSGPSRSPYSGLMRWHHYAGLLFGLVTFTWVISGGFSVNPFGMFSGGTGLTAEQREVIGGGPFDIAAVRVDALQSGMAAIATRFTAKQADVMKFRGELYLTASRSPSEANPLPGSGPVERLMISLAHPERGTFLTFDRSEMDEIASEIMAGVPVRDRAWLDRYDNYYRSREKALPLPVLRVRYMDAQQTWLYFDPRGGGVSVEHRYSRAGRWLYSALHELDIPWLYDRRPLWDTVVIGLSIGGMVLVGSTMWPGAKRVAGHLRLRSRSKGDLA